MILELSANSKILKFKILKFCKDRSLLLLMFTDFSDSKKVSWLMARCSQPFSDSEVFRFSDSKKGVCCPLSVDC